jgi:hypothetical protein
MRTQTSCIWTIISENRVANTQIDDITVTLKIVTMDGSIPSGNIHNLVNVYLHCAKQHGYRRFFFAFGLMAKTEYSDKL